MHIRKALVSCGSKGVVWGHQAIFVKSFVLNQHIFDIQVIFESFVDMVHFWESWGQFQVKGAQARVWWADQCSGGEPGTTSRCLELLVGERNRDEGKEQPSFFWFGLKRQAGSLLGTNLSFYLFCTWELRRESVRVYMFKDPFSPDHTQKLEDEWLRYFKENCKNPKMVSGTLLCLL